MNDVQFAAIKEMIQLIDEQLQAPLDLEKIATQAGISKYHFHHLFKAVTGKSVMSYVRGRKLSSSICDLLNTDLNVIDIASSYNFEHEQSYIRAFKRKFNMTPTQCRRLKKEMPIEQKIDINQMLYIGQGLVTPPRMCIVPQLFVQGLKAEVVHEENFTSKTANAIMEQYKSVYLPTIKNAIDPDIYIGLVQYTTECSGYSNHYTACTPVTSIREVVPPMVVATIQTSEYAVFRYVGFHSPLDITYAAIKDLYDYIDSWLESTAYIQSAAFHFERVNLKICSKNYCEMDIYIPIIVH